MIKAEEIQEIDCEVVNEAAILEGNIVSEPKEIRTNSVSEPKEIRYLNYNEAQLLIKSIQNNKHLCLVLLMLDAGLRVSEAISLKFGNIDFQKKIITVKSLKKRTAKNTENGTKKPAASKDFANRKIPLSQRLFLALSNYAFEFGTVDFDMYLFPSPTKPDTHICRDAANKYLTRLSYRKTNIQDLHPHALRHSFATGLVATGADLHQIADLLGHQKLDTSRIYTHIPQDALANSVNNASARNGYKRSFFNFFDFLKVKRPPIVYVQNQNAAPIVGRNTELATISAHLNKGTNVIIFGKHGTGKRLIIDSLVPDRKVLTFDDTGSIKISLVYMLLYLFDNDKEQVKTVMFKDFDRNQIESRLSRQSIKYLCDEIKSLVEPKEYILKIRQFDFVTKQSLKVIENLKDTFVILTTATEISIDKAPFFGDFEQVEIKNLNRQQSFQMIHKLSYEVKVDDYEVYRNHIWEQTDGNPKAIKEMVERYKREPILQIDNIRSVTHFGAIREWDCTYALVILIAGLAVMRYMTSELDNPGLRTIGGMAMILLLITRAFASRTKQTVI